MQKINFYFDNDKLPRFLFFLKKDPEIGSTEIPEENPTNQSLNQLAETSDTRTDTGHEVAELAGEIQTSEKPENTAGNGGGSSTGITQDSTNELLEPSTVPNHTEEQKSTITETSNALADLNRSLIETSGFLGFMNNNAPTQSSAALIKRYTAQVEDTIDPDGNKGILPDAFKPLKMRNYSSLLKQNFQAFREGQIGATEFIKQSIKDYMYLGIVKKGLPQYNQAIEQAEKYDQQYGGRIRSTVETTQSIAHGVGTALDTRKKAQLEAMPAYLAGVDAIAHAGKKGLNWVKATLRGENPKGLGQTIKGSVDNLQKAAKKDPRAIQWLLEKKTGTKIYIKDLSKRAFIAELIVKSWDFYLNPKEREHTNWSEMALSVVPFADFKKDISAVFDKESEDSLTWRLAVLGGKTAWDAATVAAFATGLGAPVAAGMAGLKGAGKAIAKGSTKAVAKKKLTTIIANTSLAGIAKTVPTTTKNLLKSKGLALPVGGMALASVILEKGLEESISYFETEALEIAQTQIAKIPKEVQELFKTIAELQGIENPYETAKNGSVDEVKELVS